MAGQGVVGIAVDEEADAGDVGEGSVEGADDGLEGEGFDEDAGGVIGDEGVFEIDDGELPGGFDAGPRGVGWIGGFGVEEEDVLYGGTGPEGVGGVGLGVLGEEVIEEDACAGSGLRRRAMERWAVVMEPSVSLAR